MDTTVERIDRTPIEVPFTDSAAPNMHRHLPQWSYFEIIEVELADGNVGYADDMLFYGWGSVDEEDVERALGANAVEALWDDSLGSLQIALFDAVARTHDVPVYELVGDRVHDRVPQAWWCVDMPVEDWITECGRAVDAGYERVKLKGRPWRDLRSIVPELCGTLPAGFEVGIDFNVTLPDAESALPLLRDLAGNEQVTVFESPIPQHDVDGNRRLRRELDADIAAHNGRPAEMSELTQLQTSIVDEFVLGTGGPSQLRGEGSVAAMAGIPFWMQNLGFLTAIFWTHVGATMEQNRLGNVHANRVFADSPLGERIPIEDGGIPVPDAPGLGYEPDPDAVERLRCERPGKRPDPDRLIVVEWPDHDPMFFTSGTQMMHAAWNESAPETRGGAFEQSMPLFERGVGTRLVPDDGTQEWQELHDRAAEEPIVGAPEWW
jgi:L-alanine-DL-glutamate epimerase-like enolase superfamily enzyme